MDRSIDTTLVVAASNVAVDQLLGQISSHGLKVLRIGDPVRVRQELQGCTLQARVDAHPLTKFSKEYVLQAQQYVEAYELRLSKENSQKNKKKRRVNSNPTLMRLGDIIVSGDWENATFHVEKEINHPEELNKDTPYEWLSLKDLRELSNEFLNRAKDIERKAAAQIVAEADVICTTCAGAGVDLLDGLEFSSIFVDEASQCKEPESLIPLSKLSRDGKVVLIGDLNQLPPTIHSNTSQLNSLLERIVNQTLNYRSLSDDQDDEKQKLVKEIASSIPISFLGTQYRMHPSVAVFPNW